MGGEGELMTEAQTAPVETGSGRVFWLDKLIGVNNFNWKTQRRNEQGEAK